jgi:DNA-binding sugar fermentation-stimulating protein
LHEIKSIKNFIANEIIKHLAPDEQLMTYKKVNNSSIDFVIVHADSTLTPIMVSERNTSTAPKIYASFFEHYGHRIRRCIKTTPLLLHKGSYRDKEFFCVPHFMISKIVESAQ